MKHKNKEFHELTKKLGWSVQNTADHLKVSRTTVSSWRNGNRQVKETTLVLMRMIYEQKLIY